MPISQLKEGVREFLMRLYEKTGGDTAATASMYDVGGLAGMDRDASAKAAEALMGDGLAEIKTLSGGIGVTSTAVEAIENAAQDNAAQDNGPVLTDTPLMGEDAQKAVAPVLGELKLRAGDLGLEFDNLAGLIVDIRTIDIHLGSPTPKTAVVRECFKSIRDRLSEQSCVDIRRRIDVLIGG